MTNERRASLSALVAVGALLALVLAAIGFTMSRADATGGDEPCVPAEAYTETVEHPAVTHEETVVVTPAVPGQHYSLKGNSGIGKDEVPPTPAVNPSIWQANTSQEPHDNNPNITWLDGGLHYASHGSKGKRDWFFYRAPVAEVTDTVTIVDEEAWTEYIEHPAVVCETPTETPTDTPTDTPTTPTDTPTDTPTVPTEVPVTPEQPTSPVTTPEVPTDTSTPTTPTETPDEDVSEPEDDPVVQTTTENHPHKTVKTYTHESGKVTREVKHYPVDAVEEGL
jgi:hypothetical protein